MGRHSSEHEAQEPEALDMPRARVNLVLFLLTVFSVFYIGHLVYALPNPHDSAVMQWLSGWPFAVPLMGILVAHEAGHYIAARLHRVPASLPYFLPIPFPELSPFGTMGAVILMPRRIRSAKALLDIGAAGPLAGMLVAIPTMIVGLSLSPVLPRAATGFVQEGESLLYWALKRLVLGPIPSTHDVVLHPTAAAAWVGFFITFLNLVPFSQLDGGHVAFALLGKRHDAWSKRMWIVPALALLYNLSTIARPALLVAWHRGIRAIPDELLAPALSSTMAWVIWLSIIVIVRWRSGGTHPPVDDASLDTRRHWVAVGTLALFALLFMPSPFVQY
ncbi:MAG TPA: site-2 protease family protein [Polyangiaceae bacterium]